MTRSIVAVVALLTIACGEPTNDGEPLLQISAGRNSAGVTVTNREAGPISDCRVTLLDQGSDEWIATVLGPIARMESFTMRWPQFKAAGQPMPATVGQTRGRYLISCEVDELAKRRSAGFSF